MQPILGSPPRHLDNTTIIIHGFGADRSLSKPAKSVLKTRRLPQVALLRFGTYD